MLTNKMDWQERKLHSSNVRQQVFWRKWQEVDPEKIVENLSSWMFKAILVFGIPYFLFVLIKFMTL
ncbi:hypothetical protein [Tuberibacillus calidus]|uniref:hypothetical protein n=1 Tax=Tuberibacillus calidus TaxID=340097 RepID=UPI000423E9D1|nr:hypothetical protein [Tuberibacillus calidus]